MTDIGPADLRALLDARLDLFGDDRFAQAQIAVDEQTLWPQMLARFAELGETKRAFFDKYGYGWALSADAYASVFEALLQWRLLNVLSDIAPDHPSLDRCRDIVVRIIPTSCARLHLRHVGPFRVILLTNGYLSAFKGFIRLWLRGCALGRPGKPATATAALNIVASAELLRCYERATVEHEAAMARSAMAYVGTLTQLLNNEPPVMDNESIFDGEILRREDWQELFGLLAGAIDGFLLFHEVAHILAGDTFDAGRSLAVELAADRGSVSLCIIDEAREGGVGTATLGAPMFFCVELLRLLCEEVLEIGARRHDPAGGRYPGIEELLLRSSVHDAVVKEYLGPLFGALHDVWRESMTQVFDTTRWALLDSLRSSDAIGSLSQFLARLKAERSGAANA